MHGFRPGTFTGKLAWLAWSPARLHRQAVIAPVLTLKYFRYKALCSGGGGQRRGCEILGQAVHTTASAGPLERDSDRGDWTLLAAPLTICRVLATAGCAAAAAGLEWFEGVDYRLVKIVLTNEKVNTN